MLNAKTAKNKMRAVTKAVGARMDHITASEKIAGAAVLGAAVGAAATALGSALLHDKTNVKTPKPLKKPAA